MSVQVLRDLEAEGFFDKARDGDHRACGLFARLAAYRLNPSGNPAGWGCLRKTGGGANVEGYSEDAIVLGNDPNNYLNVVDIIGGAGAPGARLAGSLDGFVGRRSSDVWEKPVPLTPAQIDYLKPGSGNVEPGNPTEPVPPPQGVCRFAPTVGLSTLNEKIDQAVTMVDACHDDVLEARTEVEKLRLLVADLIARMEQGFVIDANVKYLGAMRGTVRLPKGE